MAFSRWNVWRLSKKQYELSYYKDGYFHFQDGHKIKKEKILFSHPKEREEFEKWFKEQNQK